MRFIIRTLKRDYSVDTVFPPTRLIDDGQMPERAIGFTTNRSYHCPQCGRIWAEWEKEDVEPGTIHAEWLVYRRSCPDHPKGWWRSDIPGSLLLGWNDIFVVPREILEREVFIVKEIGWS